MLERHLVKLVTNEPFYSHISRRINKIRSSSLPTATVHIKNGEFFLTWNPEYLKKQTDAQVQELLKHEFLHLVLGHCTTRIRFINKSPYVWFWAADLSINCLLDTTNLPSGGIVPGEFPRIPEDQHSLYSPDFLRCHEKLVEMMRSFPSFKSADWYFEKLSKDSDVVKAIEELSKKNKGSSCGSHDLWEDMTEEDRRLGEKKVENLFDEAVDNANSESGGWGTVPYVVQRILKQIKNKELPCGDLLRYFCGIARSADRSRTFKRLSRRHSLFPGLKRKRTGRIVVAIDMSASVTDNIISQIFGALEGLAEHIEFTVIFFDSVVDDCVFVWKRGEKILPRRVRYGGTNFDAPTKWVNERRENFDGLMIITDGAGKEPILCLVRRCWVLTPLSFLRFKTNEMIVKMRSR